MFRFEHALQALISRKGQREEQENCIGPDFRLNFMHGNGSDV